LINFCAKNGLLKTKIELKQSKGFTQNDLELELEWFIFIVKKIFTLKKNI
jgi:hypothetical protein